MVETLFSNDLDRNDQIARISTTFRMFYDFFRPEDEMMVVDGEEEEEGEGDGMMTSTKLLEDLQSRFRQPLHSAANFSLCLSSITRLSLEDNSEPVTAFLLDLLVTTLLKMDEGERNVFLMSLIFDHREEKETAARFAQEIKLRVSRSEFELMTRLRQFGVACRNRAAVVDQDRRRSEGEDENDENENVEVRGNDQNGASFPVFMVMRATNCSEEDARCALAGCDGDVSRAIVALRDFRRHHAE